MSEVRMIDVGDKPVTRRRARAGARVRLAPAVVAHIPAGTLPKGDGRALARGRRHPAGPPAQGRLAPRAARRGDPRLEADARAPAALPSARADARRGDAGTGRR